jgi:hypothetical protein
MALYAQKLVTDLIEAWQWPEGGVSQHKISQEIERSGLKLGLYDGTVTRGDFADGSKWQWESASLSNTGKYVSAKIGDWIVWSSGEWHIMTDEKFKEKYRGFV